MIEGCGLVLPIGFDLDAGSFGTSGCCCSSIGGQHVLLHGSRVGQYFIDTQGPRITRLLGTVDGCRYLSVDLNDVSIDGNTACPLCVNADDLNIVNPIITADAVYRVASTTIADTSSGCSCETENYTFQADSQGNGFIIQSIWQVVPLLVTVGSANYVRFTAYAYNNSTSSDVTPTPIVTYVSDDIPIGSDLDIRNVGEVELTIDDPSSSGGYCDFPETITLTPVSADSIQARNILNGTNGCGGEYKSCCERWGSTIDIQVKPLECDIEPEDFVLTEVSPAESPRRWTGTAALSCGDTYQMEFICDSVDGDDCTDQFQLTFTPDCGSTTPIVATITDCECGTEPPTFTYTAARGEGESSDGCSCCSGSPCSGCSGNTPKQYQVDANSLSGMSSVCDCSELTGTWILEQREDNSCVWEYEEVVECSGGSSGVFRLRLTRTFGTSNTMTLAVISGSGGGSTLVLYSLSEASPGLSDCQQSEDLPLAGTVCGHGSTFVTVTPL